MHKNIVHVVGTGTIGEPLIGLLANFREAFGIDEITFHKRTPLLTDRSKVSALVGHGAKLCVDKAHWRAFSDLDMEPHYEAEEAIERAKVVIDCTPAGNANKEKYYNRFATNGCGFIAQGSEFGFGKMYAHGKFQSAIAPPDHLKDVIQRISANPRIALTNKKSSAAVFSFGRDHGLFGRILNQTVVALQSLALRGDRELVGMCFTPQDGNSLMSSIAAALWFLDAGSYKQRLAALGEYCFQEI